MRIKKSVIPYESWVKMAYPDTQVHAHSPTCILTQDTHILTYVSHSHVTHLPTCPLLLFWLWHC
jgi:hypothetical protein